MAEREDRRRRVVLLGECMLELQGQAFGTLRQAYGGDTFNTAVYLSRCGQGLEVAYASAVGVDSLSDGLVQRWADQGLRLDLLRRIPGRLPGMYLIELDSSGERSFHFWRDSSAARHYFDAASSPLEEQASRYGCFYLSGISLAILAPAARERVFALMARLRREGGQVVFDNNYRPTLWPEVQLARACFERAFELATLVLATLDDHQRLFAQPDEASALAQLAGLPVPELVIKRGPQPTLVRSAARQGFIAVDVEPVARVADTTGAGDSFAAGYIACRLAGSDIRAAAQFGNRLAGRVIQHHGAVIDTALMQDLVDARPLA